MEKEAFFKDQCKNGRMEHNFMTPSFVHIFCSLPGISIGCQRDENLRCFISL